MKPVNKYNLGTLILLILLCLFPFHISGQRSMTPKNTSTRPSQKQEAKNTSGISPGILTNTVSFTQTTSSGLAGDNFQNPIDAGQFTSTRSFNNTQNTTNFTSVYGSGRRDIIYRFVISQWVNLQIHCSPNKSAAVGLYLLDSTGSFIVQGSGTLNSHTETISMVLNTGVYYVVCESDNNVDLSTSINTSPTPHILADYISNPLDIGTFDTNFSFSDTDNTMSYTNTYGDPSKDIFYSFTITHRMNIIIDHCGSDVEDTFLHLLDDKGVLIIENDWYDGDDGCDNPGHAYISTTLTPGTYILAVEGYDEANGSITTNIQGVVVDDIQGDTFLDPIDAGTFPANFHFSDTRNTNNYLNKYYGQAHNDISAAEVFYKFTLTNPTTITINHCGSAISPTFLYLLSESGCPIAAHSVSGSTGCCNGGYQACLEVELEAGTYYVISEGEYDDGLLQTTISGGTGENETPGDPEQPPVSVTPSANRNYIHTIIPQIATTSIPAGSRSPSEYSETVEYFDGLGRPMQTVAVGASPDGKDIVTPIAYDAFGREAKKYLPYESGSGDGTYKTNALAASGTQDAQSTWYSNVHAGIPADTRPYTEAIFEPSPLNRITEQYGPGQRWRDYDRSQTINYKTNTANEVRLWSVLESQVISNGHYDPGTLFVKETADEDGRAITEYTDLMERIVRKKQYAGNNQYAITDYAYDDFGRLAYVIPPAIAVEGITSIPVLTDPLSKFAQYVYAYRYDARGRVVEKHIPGAGWTYIVYNKLDYPILTQDAVQRESNKWSFTKYDAHGRVIMTGLYTSTTTTDRETIQNMANGTAYAQWETRSSGESYPNTAFPTSNYEMHTVNYYDNYSFTTKSYPGSSARIHGLATGSKVKVLDSSPEQWLYTAIFYDEKGRVIHTKTEQAGTNNSKVADETTNTYDFTGRLLSSERNYNNNTVRLTVKNEYDHAGRLETVKYNTGNDDITVARNTYNPLGQLTQVALHDGFETTNYDYNIRGWLTGISSEHFKQRLYYNSGLLAWDAPQWAGNICGMEWQNAKVNDDWNAYMYYYDRLNRLTYAYYQRRDGTSSGYPDNQVEAKSDHYSEMMGYREDLMGNLDWLTRFSGGNCVDDVVYHYGNGGHTPTRVRDYSDNDNGYYDRLKNSSLYYEYDASGRLKKDNNKQHTYTYNHLGLLKGVVKDGVGDTLSYTYDATGGRVKKKLGTTERLYTDGIEISGDTALIHTAYGRLRRIGVTNPWIYDYFLKDHLGNVRVVLTAGISGTATYMATMEENRSGTENLYFANIENTRADRPYNYPDNNPLNTKLAKVPGKSKGPSIMLKVMAGDTIGISAKAFYNMDNALPDKGIDVAPVVGSAIAVITNPASTALGEAAQLAADLGTEASQSVALLPASLPKEGAGEASPNSGINFVAYSQTFDIIEANTGVLLVEDKINTIQTLATDKIIIQEAGFLEIFVNNEAQTPVYYDNLMVTQSTGNVTEVNAYYPFGMLIPGLSTPSLPGEYNAYKFSAKEIQEMTGWGDHGARMMDYVIGRWWVSDPLAEMYYSTSPYAYCLNNPIKYFDPNGLSTHTDSTGRVLAVYDDDDLNVYSHNNLPSEYATYGGQTKTTTDPITGETKTIQLDRLSGGDIRGETEFWDEFISPESGNVMSDVTIQFDMSWDPIIGEMSAAAQGMNLAEIASNSSPGRDFDIKNTYGNVGAKLNGKYATSRSAGNYLAGYNAQGGKMMGVSISFTTFQKLAGALHVKGSLTTSEKAGVVLRGTSYGPAPFYGENYYQYRMSRIGWNRSLKQNR